MPRFFLRTIAALLATVSVATAEPSFDEALHAATRQSQISGSEVTRAAKLALWNVDKTAAAVVLKRPEASLVLVFLRKPNGEFATVDVSDVESGNFGKLGFRRSHYQRFETTPVEWRQRTDGLFQVVMQTRAWASGQRYTASEPLIIRPDGTPLWR